MAKGKSTWKYNKLLTARRNYFDGLSGPSQIQRLAAPPAFSPDIAGLGGITPPQTIKSPLSPSSPSQGGSNIFKDAYSDVRNLFKNPSAAFTSTTGDMTQLLGSAVGALGDVGGKLLSNGLESKAGGIVSGIGDAVGGIPLIGGFAKGALNLVGGGINALFGSKMNQENINAVQGATAAANSATASANTFDDLAATMSSSADVSGFNNKFIGRDGLFSSKAKKMAKKLRAEAKTANKRQALTMVTNAENIASDTMSNLEANYAAFGGPMDFGGGAIGFDFMNRYIMAKEAAAQGNNNSITSMPNSFASGGSIHIKPENRGKFTETKRRTGKTTEELTHSSNPLTRKRAIFAQNARKWHHAFGGELNTHGADFTNGMVVIGNGGSHESNPFEGVPMGMDPEGVPNLVEEGETIFNDYVFSKRLAVPQAIREKYKLRGTKDMSFAEASKLLARESEERPNDPISERGMQALMADLANAQESVKGEQQARQFAKGGNLFEDGGRPNTYKGLGKSYNRGWFGSDGKYTQEYLDRVNNMTLDQLQAQFDRQREFYADEANRGTDRWRSIDNFYRNNPGYNNPDYRVTEADLTFAKKGAQDYNPGYLHDLAFDATTPAPTPEPEPRTASAKRYFTYGTTDPIDYFEGRNKEGKTWFDLNPGYSFVDKNGTVRDPVDVDGVSTTYTDYYLKKAEPEEVKNDTEEWKPGKYADWLRYAPAVGFGIGALTDAFGLTNKPDYSNADAILEATRNSGTFQPVQFNPIGNYLAYNPFDRDFYLNKLNAEAGATRRAILQNAGMNRGAGMAAILAADNNAQSQIGALARQAEEYNLAQRQQVEDFNRATNMTNSQGFLQADIANQKAQAELRDFSLKGTLAAAEMRERARMASDQAKSANLSGLFQTLGDIGFEEKNAKMRDWAIRHGVFGPGTEDAGRVRKKSKGGKIKRKRGLTF